MAKRKPQVCVTAPLPVTSQGLVRLGNDCLIVILSFLLVSVAPNDYAKLRRWIRIRCVCKQLYGVCHSPQLVGLLNVKVGSLKGLQKLSRMSGVSRLCCEIETAQWYDLLPKFKSLQELTLLRDVTGEVFKFVALFTTLKSLHIRNVRSPEMFQICSTLTSLEKLRLPYGLTDQSLKSTVALFSNLHYLDMSFCSRISDEGLKMLSHLRLRTLDVSNTKISDIGLCALKLDGMEKLEIHDSGITRGCFAHLGSGLLSLKVSGSNCLNGSAALVALTSLTELVVLGNSTYEFIQDLSKLTNLRRLGIECVDYDLSSLSLPIHLQSLSLTVVGEVRHFSALSSLGHLESLEFCLNNLVVNVDHLSVLTRLKELDLSCNYGLISPALQSVSCLKSLRSLNISYCTKLTDESLRWIEQLPQLEVLKFAGTKLRKATVMERLPHVEWN